MVKPRVVGVIPLHNHARWILDAIYSLVNQDYKPEAIVVINDGSTDVSREVVLGAISSHLTYLHDCRTAISGTIDGVDIRYLEHPEACGPAAARNTGIKALWDRADLFALLDSDDLYEPGKIRRSVEHFTRGVGVVYSDNTVVHEDGRSVREWRVPFSQKQLFSRCIVNCDSLVSKEAFSVCGLFDESLRVCEDYDLWVRVSKKFYLAHVPEPLVTIRAGRHSSTFTVANEIWAQCHEAIRTKHNQK